jgi:hypothetical protein
MFFSLFLTLTILSYQKLEDYVCSTNQYYSLYNLECTSCPNSTISKSIFLCQCPESSYYSDSTQIGFNYSSGCTSCSSNEAVRSDNNGCLPCGTGSSYDSISNTCVCTDNTQGLTDITLTGAIDTSYQVYF